MSTSSDQIKAYNIIFWPSWSKVEIIYFFCMNPFSADTFPTHKILISSLEIDIKVLSKI